MNYRNAKTCFRRRGAALILVMVVLVVLTAIMYRIGSSVSQWKHRQQYLIDYQTARYACESGLKYAIVAIEKLEPNYISRPNEPDFSDLFTMTDAEYGQMMQQWAEQLDTQVDSNSLSKTDSNSRFINFSSIFEVNDINETATEPNFAQRQNLFVCGPYGPPWPYLTEPVEIEFGNARVKVEIIDENAKLPLTWGISSDEEVKQETKAAVVTFCEWMQMEPNDIKPLLAQLEEIKEIKPFSTELKPIVTITTEQTGHISKEEAQEREKRRVPRARRSPKRRVRTTTFRVTRPDVGHARDFAKIMYSTMLDTETLAKPVNKDENRKESALKYISLWGTSQVNVNTAPRHVLEAAFTFGGDAVDIAEAIVNLRREKPFENVDDLKKRLFRYSSSVEKCEPYITTQSSYFSIRTEARSGVAKVCAITGLKKEEGKFQKIGIITE